VTSLIQQVLVKEGHPYESMDMTILASYSGPDLSDKADSWPAEPPYAITNELETST
jgi:hypothetical protein